MKGRQGRLTATVERWPITGSFTIARGRRTEAVVVTANISDGKVAGRGECVPYARYGETSEGVVAAIEEQADAIAHGATRADLQDLMAPGAARNAIDCALWDMEAKAAGRRAWQLAGLSAPAPFVTAYTLSLGSPGEMEAAARAASGRPLIKVKLGGEGDPDRIAAVRRAAPSSTLIVDANEAWRESDLEANMAACRAARVALIEQPLPAADDAALLELASTIPICADESAHDSASLDRLSGRYQSVNIKLDKAGGLTEALALSGEATRRGLTIFVGCMLGTSLAMAPATLLAPNASFVDLDGPLLLARDRHPGLSFEGSMILPFEASLWG